MCTWKLGLHCIHVSSVSKQKMSLSKFAKSKLDWLISYKLCPKNGKLRWKVKIFKLLHRTTTNTTMGKAYCMDVLVISTENKLREQSLWYFYLYRASSDTEAISYVKL